MHRMSPRQALKLAGFNNLTKSLSFNLYDFCVARNESERQSYIDYVSSRFNAKKITSVLTGICGIIEAQVLAVSDQNYEPWGASSMVLMSDSKGGGGTLPATQVQGAAMHLDKSHICAHTYPDFHGGGTICSFRIDIDISTCGEISPLRALNFMFERFDADVVVIDYSVRGFTRDHEGRRVYMDHQVKSIQDYIAPKTLNDYYCVDLALHSDNIWQTKMLRMQQDTMSYFRDPVDPNSPEIRSYMDHINREMRGVLHMWPD
ncbi:MAG: S-adenosylmethionine decarboxylase proenzyme precursor [Pseudomonadota bacterium]|jgi:S-adenosylmethionine decarboxylase